MKPNKLIIFGGTSSIAKLVVPQLGFMDSEIYFINRLSEKNKLSNHHKNKNEILINFQEVSILEDHIDEIFKRFSNEPVAVINFLGTFGLIENLNNFDVSSALETNRQNLLPFLLIAKLAKNLSSGSLVISFSGAGVGGSNLDDSSIGYLGAKASMSILIESFDRQLAERNIRIGLVSPGAFQSPMQRAVARANDLVIPISRINSAKQLEEEPSSPEKLITLLKYLIENPRLLGGRSWSANFDKLGVKDMNAEFGRMRRVY